MTTARLRPHLRRRPGDGDPARPAGRWRRSGSPSGPGTSASTWWRCRWRTPEAMLALRAAVEAGGPSADGSSAPAPCSTPDQVAAGRRRGCRVHRRARAGPRGGRRRRRASACRTCPGWPPPPRPSWHCGHGLIWLKAFPAISSGPPWFKAVAGPLPELRFVATGGIDAGNAADFLPPGYGWWRWAPPCPTPGRSTGSPSWRRPRPEPVPTPPAALPGRTALRRTGAALPGRTLAAAPPASGRAGRCRPPACRAGVRRPGHRSGGPVRAGQSGAGPRLSRTTRVAGSTSTRDRSAAGPRARVIARAPSSTSGSRTVVSAGVTSRGDRHVVEADHATSRRGPGCRGRAAGSARRSPSSRSAPRGRSARAASSSSPAARAPPSRSKSA